MECKVDFVIRYMKFIGDGDSKAFALVENVCRNFLYVNVKIVV